MKKLFLSTLLLALPLLASAYDIEVKNEDGVTIYYNYINNGTELEVTRGGYSGAVNIPEEATYMSRTRKVTSIGGGAFSGCSSLTTVTIPNSVACIGSSAFERCTGLTSVTIGNSVTSIGGSAFWGCSGLKKVIVKDIAAWCAISFEDNPLWYAHNIYNDENTEIKDLVIPNSVTSIRDEAFRGCTSLTSVTIGNSVTSIGNSAFNQCSGLTSVTIGNSVTSIGNSAFNQCSGLTSVTIPNSVTTIGYGAFGGCTGLTSVTIPNSVASIGDQAFIGCTSLTSVTIPNSVTSIGLNAFSGCRGLTSVTIGNSVTSIGYHAFLGCSGLTSVTIPNSVTSIGGEAFRGCTSLTSVTIGNSVTSIGNHAFYECSGLNSVISKMENPCYIDYYCFDQDVFYNVTLYVPKVTTGKYKSMDYWNRFVFIEEGEPGSSTQPEEKKCATPSISYANKKLTFSCETEGVEYHYTITDSDIKSAVASSIDLSATYEISVYATKSGYTNSDVATATLVWTDAIFTETTPTTSSAKAIAESIPVLISAKDGNITVRGEQNGLPLTVYTADGKMFGSATMKDGQASISTNLQRGEIAIVKIGSKSVKIKM